MNRCLLKSQQQTVLAGIKILLQMFLAVAALITVSTQAGTLEQAKRIHDRIAGVPPTESALLQMRAALESGNGIAAAMIAIENDNFYNATLKTWVAPWTNEEQTAFVPLNDYTATVIGAIRDELDYRTILYADMLYTANSSVGVSPYAVNNNRHYEELEEGGYSLKDTLVQVSQTAITGLPEGAAAGVVTSRAASKAFFIAGTNRASFRFTLMNHLCMDLEQVHDTTRIPDRIRQDVSRSPGGDSRVFLNSCLGCHAGMDPLTQAFAYYDYEYNPESDPEGNSGRLDYNGEGDIDENTGTRVKAKYLINSASFPYGYVTTNDQWSNYWREGVNKSLGWDTSLPAEGNGAASMLKELAHTQAFAECSVKKVFKAVCLREPENSADRNQVGAMLTRFNGSHNLKYSFAEAADYCKGE